MSSVSPLMPRSLAFSMRSCWSMRSRRTSFSRSAKALSGSLGLCVLTSSRSWSLLRSISDLVMIWLLTWATISSTVCPDCADVRAGERAIRNRASFFMDLIWPPRDLGLRAGFDLIGYFTLSGSRLGCVRLFFRPSGARSFRIPPHGLRCGLPSFAAARLAPSRFTRLHDDPEQPTKSKLIGRGDSGRSWPLGGAQQGQSGAVVGGGGMAGEFGDRVQDRGAQGLGAGRGSGLEDLLNAIEAEVFGGAVGAAFALDHSAGDEEEGGALLEDCGGGVAGGVGEQAEREAGGGEFRDTGAVAEKGGSMSGVGVAESAELFVVAGDEGSAGVRAAADFEESAVQTEAELRH